MIKAYKAHSHRATVRSVWDLKVGRGDFAGVRKLLTLVETFEGEAQAIAGFGGDQAQVFPATRRSWRTPIFPNPLGVSRGSYAPTPHASVRRPAPSHSL